MAIVAGAFAALSSAQPAVTTGGASPASAEQAKLPALPAEIKSRQRFIIGVKCDTPPFGYTDVRGQNAGVDVEIARWFARYAFGRAQRVTFVCAPTATREPLLTTNRVDLVISTFTYTADRDTRIDFSRAYYKATGRLLVKNDSPIRTLNDIRGKRVATTTRLGLRPLDEALLHEHGSRRRRERHRGRHRLQPGPRGRGDVRRHVARARGGDRSEPPSSRTTCSSRVRTASASSRGTSQLKRWVDSRLELMRKKDVFQQIIKNNVAPRFVPAFSKNILRPNNTFTYRACVAAERRTPFARST